MKTTLLTLMASITILSTTRAHACNSGSSSSSGADAAALVYTAWISAEAGTAIANIAYTISDARKAVKGTLKKNDGVGEVITMVPSLALNLYTTTELSMQSASQTTQDPMAITMATFAAVNTVWSLALFSHGVYAIRHGADRNGERDRARRRESPRWAVAPTIVSDGEHRGAGLAAVGRF
jgi:hypothetical protein